MQVDNFVAVILKSNIFCFKRVITEICDSCVNLSQLNLVLKNHGLNLVTFSFEGGNGVDDSEGTSKIDKDKTL